MPMLGHSGIQADAVRGRMRSETRMRDSLNRVGVAIIGCKFPHLAPPPVSTALLAGFEAGRAACERRPRRQHRARGSDLRSERVRGAEVQARASRGSSGKVQLLRTPRAPPPPQPQAAALCLSRKMVLESLWGREGRPHHLPLNVNYAFMNVFIGEAARHPIPRVRDAGWVLWGRCMPRYAALCRATRRGEWRRACGFVVSPCG